MAADQFAEQFSSFADISRFDESRRLGEFKLNIQDGKAYAAFAAVMAEYPTAPFQDLLSAWVQRMEAKPKVDRAEAVLQLKNLKQKSGESFADLADRTLQLVKAAQPMLLPNQQEAVAIDCFQVAVREGSMAAELRKFVTSRALFGLAPASLSELAAAGDQLAAAGAVPASISDQLARAENKISRLQQDVSSLHDRTKKDRYGNSNSNNYNSNNGNNNNNNNNSRQSGYGNSNKPAASNNSREYVPPPKRANNTQNNNNNDDSKNGF